MAMLPQRLGPRNPRLGAAAFRLALPLLERLCRHKKIFRSTSAFASEQFRSLASRLNNGEPLYLVGIGPGGIHNSGAALVEVVRETGCKIICNNEEERFSAEKHSTRYPEKSVAALIERMGLNPIEVALRFCLDHAYISSTLVGMSNAAEVHENLKAVDLHIPVELMHAIDSFTAPVHAVTWPSGRRENSDV